MPAADKAATSAESFLLLSEVFSSAVDAGCRGACEDELPIFPECALFRSELETAVSSQGVCELGAVLGRDEDDAFAEADADKDLFEAR